MCVNFSLKAGIAIKIFSFIFYLVSFDTHMIASFSKNLS
jgi:hypothetical protein